MTSQQSTMPSWQSMQRIPGGGGSVGAQSYASQSPPPSSFRSGGGEYGQQSQQQQPYPGSQARFRPSTAGVGGSSSSGSGRVNRSNSYLGSTGTSSSPPPSSQQGQPWPQQQGSGGGTPEPQQQQLTQQQQQQAHRRTQSLRPMSAFQPLENVDGPYAGGPGTSPRPPSPTGSTSRSIRTAAAPLTFKAPELRSALSLQEAQARKIYMEGYLSKRDHLAPDGRPLASTDPRKRWQLCFVQLCGTVLSVWNVHQMEEAARQGTEVPPSYINVTDCFVDFVGVITESPQDVPGSRGRYENVFSVNTAGQNRILFGVEGSVGRRLVQAWVNGIRLASWEKVRLEEIYTGSLVRARLGAVSAQQATSGPGGAPGDVEMSIKSPLNKSGRMEGWVKARFMGSTEWRKCWLVLTDKGVEAAVAANGNNEADAASVTSPRNSFWSKLKAGDRGSLIGSSPSTPALADTGVKDMEVPPGNNGAPGLACFYETKKAKKPFATMAYAAHAFAVYPSRPELVEGSSLFKVEGAFPLSSFVSATNRIRQTGWVMIMPELDGSGGSNKGANAEMMKWCIAFMDAFRLYGRPTQFQWDARNPVSPFFAYPIGPYKDRLFLDRELSEFLDIREERHLANRNNLHGIMSARMRGERTPILPPLPQPNVESTRGLNGPAGSGSGAAPGSTNKSGARQSQQFLPPSAQAPPAQQQQDEDPSAADAATSRNELPPLNTGGTDTAAYALRSSQLSSIGERSREGSVMTNFTQTPISPSTATTPGPNNAAAEQQQQPPSATQSAAAAAAAAVAASQASQTAGVPILTTTNGRSTPSSVQQQAAAVPVTKAAVDTSKPVSEATAASADVTRSVANRKDSDPMASYGEGALYFINSMGDTLPSVSPKIIDSKPLPAPTTAVATSSAPALAVKNDAARQNGAAPQVSKPVGAEGTTPNVDALDSDARAAYSFLDRSPSPPAASHPAPTVSAVQQASSGAPPAVANVPAVTAYPSSFTANNKAQERKLAAQAQAQAHTDALGKPGRASGAARGSKLSTGKRHAWGEDEDEDEEDEDEDDDDDAKDYASQGVPPQASFTGAYNGARPTGTPPAQQARQAPYKSHLSASAAAQSASRGSSPGGASFDSNPRSNTLVHLSRGEQPGAISTAFQPHGLLQAGEQDKAERSAKQMEAEARATGGHFVQVDNKPPPPQAGLVGAISAHERDRRKDGGLGATLTERERERVQAERRQRDEDAMRAQMMQQQQQQQQQFHQQQMMMAGMHQRGMSGSSPPPPGTQPGWPPQPAFNPMMWQQMQMMSMMNPMMFGAPPPGSQSGHGHGGSGGSGSAPTPADLQQQQAAQLRAAQAAQQAYMQALQQSGGGGELASSPTMPPMSMPMMAPFNPYMSMYGAPMGFPNWGMSGVAGSEVGGAGGPMMTVSPTGRVASPPRTNDSPDARGNLPQQSQLYQH